MRPAALTLALALLSIPAAAAPAPAGAPAPAATDGRADQNADLRAKELFQAQRYAEALQIYSGLHARSRHPTYLRNLGRCHQMMRQPDQAIGYFQAYLREARDLDAAERAEIDGYIAEMQRLRATAAAPPAPAPPPATSSVALAAAPSANTAPVTGKWWLWTGIGVVVVGAVVTAIAISASSTKRLDCPPDTICPP